MWQPSSRWKGVFPAALSARSSTRRYARSGDQRITARPDFIGIARQHDFHCELMPIANWGTFDDEEFARKNIFYLGHPEHAEFHRVMRSLAAYEKLSLGNLPEFVRPESEAWFHMPHWRDTIRDKRDPPPKS